MFHKIKFITLLFLGIIYSFKSPAAENSRSDSADVSNYTIWLNITDFTNKKISGSCKVSFISKINNLNFIDLDLLKLQVDSVFTGQTKTNFQYNDTLLRIFFSNPLNINNDTSVTVYYQGNPVMDPSGWGGFYFSGNYAFNLGVGFQDKPHVYGRVWFPCFDNFVERATYNFFITTQSTMKAFCGGILQSETDNGNNTKTWHWKLNQTIPTYLASVAVSTYTVVNLTHNGTNGAIPVVLAAVPADTTKMKNSFVNIYNAISAFETTYGPHPFEKIGFTVVPFNGGAMEHATNIAYPQFAVDGLKTYESLYAHELSHHWWGDNTTCETAGDMWLNEGMASYSEHIFNEYVYGKDKYKSEVRTQLEKVLHYAHVDDGAWRAITGIPHEYTYGTHVYQKGALVAHTLRSYLGDSLFNNCLSGFLTQRAFNSMNSYQFRDYLTQCSGINMNDFFNNWVFSPGFPHFSLLKTDVTQISADQYNVTLFIHQKLNHAPDFYTNVPLEITIKDSLWNNHTYQTIATGECSEFKTTLNYNPYFIALDMDEKLSDAITEEYKIIKLAGTYTFTIALMTLTVSSVNDSAFVRVEHNWVPPDRMVNPLPNLHLSDYRYWKIDGILPDTFIAKATIKYNGTNSTSGGYLDNELITNAEDSLVLLYRKNPQQEWIIFPKYTLYKQGSSTNKMGQIIIDSVTLGEFCFGIYDFDKPAYIDPYLNCLTTGVKETSVTLQNTILTEPNPSYGIFKIYIPYSSGRLCVYDMNGKKIMDTLIKDNTIYNLDISTKSQGMYFFHVIDKNGKFQSGKLVLTK